MMLECKYCGGTGKLHDDADAFEDHDRHAAEAERDAALARVKLLEDLVREAIGEPDEPWYERAAAALGEEASDDANATDAKYGR